MKDITNPTLCACKSSQSGNILSKSFKIFDLFKSEGWINAGHGKIPCQPKQNICVKFENSNWIKSND